MKEIIMYTSDTCPHCRTAKNFLVEKGYHFKERNINKDPVARQELMNRNIMSVPTFIIGGESVIGFDKPRIEHIIDYTIEYCPDCKHRMRVPKGVGKIKVKCSQCGHAFIKETHRM